MSDLSAYRDKAANYGRLANQAEQDKDYQLAFDNYTKALDIFSHMIKCK
jgi:MIT (microtubule interacting and transport) domain